MQTLFELVTRWRLTRPQLFLSLLYITDDWDESVLEAVLLHHSRDLVLGLLSIFFFEAWGNWTCATSHLPYRAPLFPSLRRIFSSVCHKRWLGTRNIWNWWTEKIPPKSFHGNDPRNAFFWRYFCRVTTFGELKRVTFDPIYLSPELNVISIYGEWKAPCAKS